MENLLKVDDLKTYFKTHIGDVQAVRGISLYVNKGEALGIVGESGCGKSVSMMSIMKLLESNAVITSKKIIFDDIDIGNMKEKEFEKLRGNKISMIFQDPMTSLNPLYTIGNQMTEHLIKHKRISKKDAYDKAVKMLEMVGISSAEKRMHQYPHEFSGGMRQRVMIAMSIICEPSLIIADEPTTALDVTIQAQILDILKDLKEKMNTSVILITHDLGIVADLCSRINVMYGGIIVEEGSAEDIFYNSKHPYTWGLLRSVPNSKSKVKEKLKPIDGQPPDLLKPPLGCPFAPRCDYTMKVCLNNQPPLLQVGTGHKSACWLCHEYAAKSKKLSGGEI